MSNDLIIKTDTNESQNISEDILGDENNYFYLLFQNDILIRELILSFLKTVDLLNLRLLNTIMYNVILEYLKNILLQLDIMDLSHALDIYFWETSINYFFRRRVNLICIDRSQDEFFLNAVKKIQRQGFYFNLSNTTSRCLFSIDHWLPEYIQICDPYNPQRHTCINQRISNHSVLLTNAPITFSEFLQEYKNHIESKIVDEIFEEYPCTIADYLCSRDTHFIILLFETFLKGMEYIVENRKGIIKYFRTNYIENGGCFLYHRIWYHIHIQWSKNYNLPPAIQRRLLSKLRQTDSKKATTKKWTVQINTLNTSSIMKSSSPKETPKKSTQSLIEPNNLNDQSLTSLYLYIMDHFEWEF